jgi:hypothetical protein
LGPDSGESDDDRIKAVQLLGELRSFESADHLVGLIAVDNPAAIQAAAQDALGSMTPHARPFFQQRLKTAEGASRERLLKAFRSLEGEAVADFLLNYWSKEAGK